MNTTIDSTTTGRISRRLATGALLVAVLAVTSCADSREASPDSSSVATTDGLGTDGGVTSPDPTGTEATGPDSGPLSDTDEDAADHNDDSSGFPDGEGGGGGDQGGGSGQGGELDPWGDQPAPSGLCDDAVATGATLLVTPDPAVLPSGTMSSALTITNCGDDAVDWTASTVPNVALANGGGNLGAGSSSELGFTIDSGAYEPGAVTFKIKVSEPGHNHYVDIHAFRQLVGSDLAGSFDLTAGEGAGGCANQCITSGSVSGNATTPNVTMEVGTNTPAVITVWISEQAPVEQDGHPTFPGVAPYGDSGGETTSWSTTLAPLAAATKYHLIVAATDEFDHTSYRTGSFTTMTPVELPADVASPDGPAGCAAQCITTALVSPGSDAASIHVELHTSALIDVWVSTDAPDLSGDEPTFDGDVDKAATSDPLDVTEWDGELGDLYADTDYHIIVRARDLSGFESYRVGTFHTANGPQIVARFRSVHVVEDGDGGDHNRGELSFRWGFSAADGILTLGSRGEEKIHSGTAFLLPDDPAHTAFVFEDDGGMIPTLYISAAERDPDGLIEFCALGTGVFTDAGRNGDCDLKWTSASSGFVWTSSFADMPRCSQFGLEDIADLPCLVLESTDEPGDDYPLFWAVVSFEVLD